MDDIATSSDPVQNISLMPPPCHIPYDGDPLDDPLAGLWPSCHPRSSKKGKKGKNRRKCEQPIPEGIWDYTYDYVSESQTAILRPIYFPDFHQVKYEVIRLKRFVSLLRNAPNGRLRPRFADLSDTASDLVHEVQQSLVVMGKRLETVLEAPVAFADGLPTGVADVDEEWWSYCDITALTYKELSSALAHRPVSSAESWSWYLRSRLPQAAQAPQPPDENSMHMSLVNPGDKPDPNLFLHKVLRVIQELRKLSHGNYHVFHMLVFVLAQKWSTGIGGGPVNPRVYEWDHSFSRIRKALMRVLTEKSFGAAYTDLFEDGVVVVEDNAPFATFWGFAAAYRELWAAFETYQCQHEGCDAVLLDPPNDPLDWRHRQLTCCHPNSVTCYRKVHLGLLEQLQKAAWTETWNKVRYVAGSRLPAELVDVLFEHALAAEGLPCESEIWEAMSKPKPRLWEFDDGQWPNLSQGYWRLTEPYRCETYPVDAVQDEV